LNILNTRTYRKAKVKGVKFRKSDMTFMHEKIEKVLGHPPGNHTCYLIQEYPNLYPFWVEFSDQIITVGELIEGEW
jgi:hypothetical protein